MVSLILVCALAAPPLTLDDAVSLALTRNRSVTAARLQVEAAEYERLAAGLIPNPEISYSLGNLVVGDGNPQDRDMHPRFFEQRVQNVAISQVLDVWFKRSLRVRAAGHGVLMQRALLEDAIRDVQRAVRSAFSDVLREQSEFDFAQQIRARYDDTVGLSRKRRDAGDISEAELRKVELEGLKYANAEIDARTELANARQRLAALLMYDSAAELPDSLDEKASSARPTLPAREALVERALQQRPDVRAAELARQGAELRLRAEEREPLPDPEVGVGYTASKFMISGDNPHTLGLQVSIPIPLFQRNQAGIAQARLRIQEHENELARLSNGVRHDVAIAMHQAERANALLEQLEGGMLGRAETALHIAEKSYQAGASSLLETLEAQRTYIETRASYLATRDDLRQAWIDLAYAVGGEVP